jgi:hypothetical protein
MKRKADSRGMRNGERFSLALVFAAVLGCGDGPNTGAPPDASDPSDSGVATDAGPNSAQWVPAGGQSFACNGDHTVTPLSAGKALVVGSCQLDGQQVHGAIYDGEAEQWLQADPVLPRRFHAAVRLEDGRVLITGGQRWATEAPATSTELFDPSTGTWFPGPELTHARAGHVAVGLGDGRVIVAGGHPEMGVFGGLAGVTPAAEILDDGQTQWSDTMPMVSARARARAVVLPSGDVLLCSGIGEFSDTSRCEIFDPVAEEWRWSAFLGDTGDSVTHTITRTGDTVIAVLPLGSMRYDVAEDTWQRTDDMVRPRTHHIAVALLDGRVVVAGGTPWAELVRSELYSPTDDSWSEGPMHSGVHLFAEAALLSNGRVLLVGETGAELFVPGD